MIRKNINSYSNIRPDKSMCVLCYSTELDIFSSERIALGDSVIYDLSNINDWSIHAALKKKYWMDVTLHVKAYKIYYDEQLPESPVMSKFSFIEQIIYDKDSFVQSYYKPLLRNKKISRLIDEEF